MLSLERDIHRLDQSHSLKIKISSFNLHSIIIFHHVDVDSHAFYPTPNPALESESKLHKIEEKKKRRNYRCG